MARRVFYSFHFDNDCSRTQLVRNIGALEGNKPVSANDWEQVKRGGEAAIKRWIDDNMKGRGCVVVLVGSQTASRPWVKYEIRKGWEDGKGVLGVRIHKLLDFNSRPSTAGSSPFEGNIINGQSLSSKVTLWDPPGADSKAVYASIAANLERMVEAAVAARSRA